MGIEFMAETIGKYGIGALVILVLCFISYLIIRHILKQSDRILESAMDAQREWQRVIDEHTAQAKEFHNQVSEAHKYQREEHKEIITNLREITVTLGRINGYKKE